MCAANASLPANEVMGGLFMEVSPEGAGSNKETERGGDGAM